MLNRRSKKPSPSTDERLVLFARDIAHALGLKPETAPALIEAHAAFMRAELTEYEARANLSAKRARLARLTSLTADQEEPALSLEEIGEYSARTTRELLAELRLMWRKNKPV